MIYAGIPDEKIDKARMEKGLLDHLLRQEDKARIDKHQQEQAAMRTVDKYHVETPPAPMSRKDHQSRLHKRAEKARKKQAEGKPLNEGKRSALETLRTRRQSGASWDDPDA